MWLENVRLKSGKTDVSDKLNTIQVSLCPVLNRKTKQNKT